MGYDAAQIDSRLPTFRKSFLPPSSEFKKSALLVHLAPWRWKQQGAPKCRKLLTNRYHVITQKIWTFIGTAVSTCNIGTQPSLYV